MPEVQRRRVRLTVNTTGKAPRREMLEGRMHLVAEGAILPYEGVVHGNGDPILYPHAETEASAKDWNHQPIVLYHPKEGDDFVSARQPDVLNARKMGVVLNTVFDDKLRTEFWFDEERTKAIDTRVYDKVSNGEPVEVSTGLDLEYDETPGELNGVKYKGIARNYKPDHVAVLPDKIGAFSVKMGGGLFANQLKEQPEARAVSLDRSVQEKLKGLKVETVNNELSFSDTTCQLNDLLSAKYGEPGKYWPGYVCDVYPNYAIFRKNYDYGGDRKQYMIGYTVKDDQVALTGEAKEVQEKVEYKVVNESVTYQVLNGVLCTDLNPNRKEVPVSQSAFDKKAHVTNLITNGQITEGDRAKYEALPDDIVQGIKVVKVEVAKVPDPAPVVPVANQGKEKLIVNLENLDPSIRRQVERGLAADEREKKGHVKTIMANAANPFTESFLMAKDVDELAGMATLSRSAAPADDYDPRFLDGRNPANYGPAAGTGPVSAFNNTPLEDPLEVPDPFAEPASRK